MLFSGSLDQWAFSTLLASFSSCAFSIKLVRPFLVDLFESLFSAESRPTSVPILYSSLSKFFLKEIKRITTFLALLASFWLFFSRRRVDQPSAPTLVSPLLFKILVFSVFEAGDIHRMACCCHEGSSWIIVATYPGIFSCLAWLITLRTLGDGGMRS